MTQARIAFYAPLKSPDHPIPSGDREIARLMMRALQLAGYSVDLVSEIISYQKRPEKALYDHRRSDVAAEEARIRQDWKKDPGRVPDLWFTYHPYCKSPDWLGPALSQSFGIPYVTAEACRTHQGTASDWLDGRAAVQQAVRMANMNFVLKDSDWLYLQEVIPGMENAMRIPPFLDLSIQPLKTSDPKPLFDNDAPVLLAVGMMRPGAKMASYQALAEALKTMQSDVWNLIVVGEGPERETITGLLDFIEPARLKMTGSIAHEDMFALMDQCDLLVWPGIGEAIGLVYLEAQARGLPVAALKTAGVPLVVSNNVGGLLTDPDDVVAYGAAIRRLVDDAILRAELGKQGRSYVEDKHDVAAVAALFKSTIEEILKINRNSITH